MHTVIRSAFIAGVLVFPLPLRSEIYRCVMDSGQISYQQVPCDARSEPLTLAKQHSAGSGLRPGEKALLKQYANRDRQSARKTRHSDKKNSSPDRACWQKRNRLEDLRAKLRRGYRLGQGAELHREQAGYREYLQQFCGSR